MKKEYLQINVVGLPGCILNVKREHWNLSYKNVEIANRNNFIYMDKLVSDAEIYFNKVLSNNSGREDITGDFRISHPDLEDILLVGIIKEINELNTYIEIASTGEKISCGRIEKLKENWNNIKI